jgi:hypothetical protein
MEKRARQLFHDVAKPKDRLFPNLQSKTSEADLVLINLIRGINQARSLSQKVSEHSDKLFEEQLAKQWKEQEVSYPFRRGGISTG